VASEDEIIRKLNLGSSRAIIENKPQSELGVLLINLTEEVISQLQKALVDRNINTTSQGLSQSLAPTKVEVSGDEISVGITAEFYWKFINFGVNGTEINRGAPNWGPSPLGEQSFSQAIREWIPQRGLQLPPEFNSFESFSFAIMTNIRKKGKAARPFFSDVINDTLVATLEEPITKVFGKALEIRIVEPWL